MAAASGHERGPDPIGESAGVSAAPAQRKPRAQENVGMMPWVCDRSSSDSSAAWM